MGYYLRLLEGVLGTDCYLQLLERVWEIDCYLQLLEDLFRPNFRAEAVQTAIVEIHSVSGMISKLE
jgi:hypothetical protein